MALKPSGDNKHNNTHFVAVRTTWDVVSILCLQAQMLYQRSSDLADCNNDLLPSTRSDFVMRKSINPA